MKRVLRSLGLFVAAGAVTSLFIAFVCTLWFRQPFESENDYDAAPAQLILEEYDVPIDPEKLNFAESHDRWHGRRKYAVTMTPPGEHADFGSITVIVHEAGWPWLCLHGEHHFGDSVSDDGLRSAVMIPFALRNENRVVPIQPIAAGFALNTLLYAAALWLLFGFPLECRRAVRRWRGRCIKCGYTLLDNAICPECGTPRNRLRA